MKSVPVPTTLTSKLHSYRNNFSLQGGLQAVVWTDVIQISAMFGAMALVAVKGTMDVGGIGVVWQRNFDSGRISPPEYVVSIS